MKINLIAIGVNMPDWVNDAFEEYRKRLPKSCQLHLKEINSKLSLKSIAAETIQQKETEQLMQACAADDLMIALDKEGLPWNTCELSQQLKNWQQTGKNVSLLVGGPEGLAKKLLPARTTCWSLSALTFPHPLVRVILAEQIYRAWTILQGHPYHRS